MTTIAPDNVPQLLDPWLHSCPLSDPAHPVTEPAWTYVTMRAEAGL